ncbi:MAG: SAM-dependent methyltransferase [Sciscionella sp.]
MIGHEPAAPHGVDLDHPSVARVYDYYLGGTTNWAIDREFAEKVLTSFPLVKQIAIANRLFLHRVVRHLIRLGIRQFIDIGAGVPTMGSTHQIADEVSPDSKVVYIDNEPVAVAHSSMLLEDHGDPNRHAVVNADLREPELLWHRVSQIGTLDMDKPTALLLIAVLHVEQLGPDGVDIGPEAVARYRELLPAGSYLAISHVTDDDIPEHVAGRLAALKRMYDTSSSHVIIRNHAEIRALFGELELVEPGMSWTPLWHPEEAREDSLATNFATPNESAVWAGVARKP